MTKANIAKRVYFWQQFFGLINWRITIRYEKPKNSHLESNELGTMASITSTPEYKLAVFKINPKMLRGFGDDVIVHELLHIILSSLMMAARNRSKEIDFYHEQVTAELERIILRTVFSKRKI